MNTWRTAAVTINEKEFDYDLHSLAVYRNEDDVYLGEIIFDSIEDMKNAIKELNEGGCPIKDSWEDGMGNTCSLNGWHSEA